MNPILPKMGWVFLRLGFFSYGGPIAAMSLMEDETSRKLGWISGRKFSEFYAISKLLPGPTATQMAIMIGREKAGTAGGIVAGTAFFVPSFLIMLALAWVYSAGTGGGTLLPQFFSSVQAAALVTIMTSVIHLGKPHLVGPHSRGIAAWVVLAVSAAIIGVFPAWEPLVIIGMGLLGALAWGRGGKGSIPPSGTQATALAVAGTGAGIGAAASASAATAATGTALASSSATLASLFWSAFKGGAFVFGTGLAIVPLLENDVVTKHGWLTHAQFMDGLALGQVTPGPFVITVTFIGFIASGFWGACAATAGMFIPAYINALILVPLLWSRVSENPRTAHFLDWSIPAIVGGIAITAFRLGWTQLRQPLPVLVFCVTSLLAWRYKLPGWLLILGAALAGLTFEFSALQKALLHAQ